MKRMIARPDTELTEELVGARLDALPDLPRTVFLLRHLDGLEVAAIGITNYGDRCNNPFIALAPAKREPKVGLFGIVAPVTVILSP